MKTVVEEEQEMEEVIIPAFALEPGRRTCFTDLYIARISIYYLDGLEVCASLQAMTFTDAEIGI